MSPRVLARVNLIFPYFILLNKLKHLYLPCECFTMCVNSLNIKVLFEKDCWEFGGLGFLYKHTHTHTHTHTISPMLY